MKLMKVTIPARLGGRELAAFAAVAFGSGVCFYGGGRTGRGDGRRGARRHERAGSPLATRRRSPLPPAARCRSTTTARSGRNPSIMRGGPTRASSTRRTSLAASRARAALRFSRRARSSFSGRQTGTCAGTTSSARSRTPASAGQSPHGEWHEANGSIFDASKSPRKMQI